MSYLQVMAVFNVYQVLCGLWIIFIKKIEKKNNLFLEFSLSLLYELYSLEDLMNFNNVHVSLFLTLDKALTSILA